MADQHLTFRIGSVFQGEGFKKAQKTIGDVNSGAARAAEAAEKLGGAMGGLDTSATKAFGALSSMLTSIMSLNAIAIVTQGGLIAINLVMEDMQKKAEAAAAAADELRKRVDAAFTAAVKDNAAGLNAEIKAIAGDFERITKQAVAFEAAMSGLKGSVATGGIINLEVEKINAMIDAQTDAQRQAIEAEYNLKIATEKAAASREQWSDKIAAADAAIVANTERAAILEKQLNAIAENRAKVEESMLAAKQSGSDKWRTLQDELNRLDERAAQLTSQLNDAKDSTLTLEAKRLQTIQDAENAEAQMTIAIRQAEMKQNDLGKAMAERAAAEVKAADAAEEAAEAAEQQKELAELRAEGAELQRAANKATADVAKAEREYQAALAAYNANFHQNALVEGMNFEDGLLRGGAPVWKAKGQVEQRMAVFDIEKAIKDGAILTVKQLRQVEKDAGKRAKERTKGVWEAMTQEKQKYEQLQEKSRKTWSKQDQEFAAAYEKLRDTAEAQKKDLEAKKQRLQEAKEREEKTQQSIISIAQKLDKLGLK